MQFGYNIKQNNSLNHSFFDNLYKLWEYRQLLFFLTLRDIKVRYKQAFFGIAWAILTPAIQALIFALVFGVFLKISSNPIYYLLVVLTGFIFWNFFSQSISTAIFALTGNYNLVTKTAFPKDILVLSSVLGRLPDLIASFLVLLIILFFYQLPIWFLLLWLIPLIFILLVLTISVGLFFASTNIYFRDITAIAPLFLTVWLYLSPVVYTLDSIPNDYRKYLILNPMTGILEGIRNVLLLQKPPDLLSLSVSIVITLLFFCFSYTLFKKLEKGFSDII